jgi:hypothetical protein
LKKSRGLWIKLNGLWHIGLVSHGSKPEPNQPETNSGVVNLQPQHHISPVLQGTLSTAAYGLTVPPPLPPTKLNIHREYNSLLPSRGRVECGTDLWEWGWHKEPNAESECGVKIQPPRAGAWWIVDHISWDCEQSTMLSCPTFLEEGLTSQSQSCFGATQ